MQEELADIRKQLEVAIRLIDGLHAERDRHENATLRARLDTLEGA